MPYAQFRHLAAAARRRILVAFATGLCIVERPQPIANILYLIKLP
jgi:hypothetical protein